MSDIDYSSPVGQVRLLIPDVEELEDPRDLRRPAEYIFSDEQIRAYLTIEGGNVKCAAASALAAIAASEVLILKVIKTDDKVTDGAKVGAELRARAKMLRDEAAQEQVNDTTFELIDFTYRPEDWAWH